MLDNQIPGKGGAFGDILLSFTPDYLVQMAGMQSEARANAPDVFVTEHFSFSYVSHHEKRASKDFTGLFVVGDVVTDLAQRLFRVTYGFHHFFEFLWLH